MSISVPELAGVQGIQWYQADETATDTTKTIILRGKADHAQLFNDAIMEALRESRIGEYGYYVGHVIRYGSGRQYDEVDITCIDLNVTTNSQGYYSRYEAQARTESRPLEEKLNQVDPVGTDEIYKVWWNHRIAGKKASSLTVSAGDQDLLKAASALTDGFNGATLDYDNARWVKTNQALKDGEEIIFEARFPGVQSYGVGVEQVKEIIYSRNIEVVQDAVSKVGWHKVPYDSYSSPYDTNREDASEWLITGASFVKKSGWYEGSITYAYAKSWLYTDDGDPVTTGVYPTYTSTLWSAS